MMRATTGELRVSALEGISSAYASVQRVAAYAGTVRQTSDLDARLAAANITLPQLLRIRAQQHPDTLAIREKEFGI